MKYLYFLIFLFIFFNLVSAHENIQDNKELFLQKYYFLQKKIPDIQQYTECKNHGKNEYANYEFPKYYDLELANSIIKRFSVHNENYFIPLYYSIFGTREGYNPYEVKLQISAKVSLFGDLFYGIGLFFGYTQTSFFQMYSGDISAPFRDSDYMPEITFYRALDFDFLGGKFYNIRFGYTHLSNGESEVERSRSIDRIIVELMYKHGDFNTNLKTWWIIKKDPIDINKYVGYSNLVLSYKFLERNHIILTVYNLLRNYKRDKGATSLEYKFDLSKISFYMHYFYGYGDNIFQYNIKSQSIGVGFSLKR